MFPTLGLTFFCLILICEVVQAEPRLFSSGGGMGHYDHYYLVRSEPAGLNNNIALVRTVNNSGEVAEDEWIVNCNDTFPQVVDPSGQNLPLSFAVRPPKTVQTQYELWWAVCRKQFEKHAESSAESPSRLHAGQTGSIAFGDGHRVDFEVLPAGEAALVASLAKISLVQGRAGKGQEIVFAYCSDSVPTVKWPEKLIELSVADDPGRYETATVLDSQAVYRLACGGGPSTNAYLTEIGRSASVDAEKAVDAGGQASKAGASPVVHQPHDGDQIRVAGGVSSFRGISLGMSLSEMHNNISGLKVFNNTISPGGADIFFQKDESFLSGCGSAYLKNGVVYKFVFLKCYFDLNNYGTSEFARKISDAYQVDLRPGVKDNRMVYEGETANEHISIYQDITSGASGVEVTQRLSGTF